MYSFVVLNNNNTWKQIWNARIIPNDSEIITLQHLIRLNGFDKTPNTFTDEEWYKLVSYIIDVAQIDKHNSVLEIGCGSGALLKVLNDEISCEVYGVDESKTLCNIAKKVLPKNIIYNFEASKISRIESKFDCIIFHSVIQYFPNQSYLLRVLNKSIDLLNFNGKIVLLDLPDLSYKNDITRDPVISALKKQAKPSHLNHLFCDKLWLNDALIDIGFSKISQLRYPITNYYNSKYRFSLMAEKK